MSNELMTEAICWETDSKVSVEFAYDAKDLFYFCPEAECLAEVVPARIKNTFFRALNSHVPGCVNEKKKTIDSPVPIVPVQRESIVPPPPIPSHLGPMLKPRKVSRPSRKQMQDLALQTRLELPLHPGTLQDVVNAWCSMGDTNTRKSHPLQIASQSKNYLEAFTSFSYESENGVLDAACKIIYGQATASYFNSSYYLQSRIKFKIGEQLLPIRIRIKRDDALYPHLKNNENFMLFLHGPIPPLAKYIEIEPAGAYSGMVVRRSDLSSLTP